MNISYIKHVFHLFCSIKCFLQQKREKSCFINKISINIWIYLLIFLININSQIFSQLTLRRLIFCILKIMNSQNKYIKDTSQIKSKQNWTGVFQTPCTDYIFYEYSRVPYFANCLVQFRICAKGPHLTSNNYRRPFWIHFAVLCIYIKPNAHLTLTCHHLLLDSIIEQYLINILAHIECVLLFVSLILYIQNNHKIPFWNLIDVFL